MSGQTPLPSTPVELPLLPLRDVVVFPHMVIPLFVGRPKSIKALEAAMEGERRIMLVAQKAAAKDEPSVEDMFEMGCVASILQMLKLPDGTVKVLVEGVQRAKVLSINDGETHFVANVTPIDPANERAAAPVNELEALRRAAIVERIDTDHWRVPGNLLERGVAHDLVRDGVGVRINMLSPIGLDRQVNYEGATKHRDKVVKTLTSGVAMLLDKNKVDVIEGFGSVTDDGNVKIGGQFDGTEIETGRRLDAVE